MSDKEIIDAILCSASYSEVCRKLGVKVCGFRFKQIKKIAKENNIDCSHFGRMIKYHRVSKECPVCKVTFTCDSGGKNVKTTCSYSCSNSFFRRKHDNGRYIDGRNVYGKKYRTVCINYYGHKCLLCDWSKCVEVHHIDGNHKNDELSNLVPLCPNHHKLTIMKKYKDEIDLEIIEAIKNFNNSVN